MRIGACWNGWQDSFYQITLQQCKRCCWTITSQWTKATDVPSRNTTRSRACSLKRRPVAIQLEQLDMEGKYLDDVVGMIKGYDELGIYIDDQKVDYDEIRHVELYDWHKWSELKWTLFCSTNKAIYLFYITRLIVGFWTKQYFWSRWKMFWVLLQES